MTKEQIEQERVRFEKHFKVTDFTRLFGGDYAPEVQAHFRGWLAAKQDAEQQLGEYLQYLPSGNGDHLPNCKGDNRG